MTGYVQARPSTGYLVHAVPSGNARSGHRGQYIGGRALCDRVKNRDSWGTPHLIVVNDTDGKPLEFDPENTPEKACVRCNNRLARQVRKEAA